MVLVARVISADARAESRPSIMFVMADDLGIGDVGAYNPARVGDTPNMDLLAREGLRLTNFRVMSPMCSPSRAAFLVGKESSVAGYPNIAECASKDGYYVDASGLRREVNTDAVGRLNETWASIPHAMQHAGYYTAHLGVWQLGCDGLPSYREYGWNRAVAWQTGDDASYPIGWPRYAAHDALSWTDKHSTSEAILNDTRRALDDAGGRRYFLSINPAVPSAPLSPRREHMAAVGPKECDLEAFWRDGFAWTQEVISNWKEPEESRGSRVCVERVYRGSVFSFDVLVGELLAALDERGLASETLVMITSDNGPESVDSSIRWSQLGSAHPYRGFKRSLYEGGVRVPCILRWPGHLERASSSAADILAVDILPTFAFLAGASSWLDGATNGGRALAGRVARELVGPGGAEGVLPDRGHKEIVFWEWAYSVPTTTTCNASAPRFAARQRDSDLKLLVELPRVDDRREMVLGGGGKTGSPMTTKSLFSRTEMYNITADPGESVDLLEKTSSDPSSVWDELAAPLARALLSWYRRLPKTLGKNHVPHHPCRTPSMHDSLSVRGAVSSRRTSSVQRSEHVNSELGALNERRRAASKKNEDALKAPETNKGGANTSVTKKVGTKTAVAKAAGTKSAADPSRKASRPKHPAPQTAKKSVGGLPTTAGTKSAADPSQKASRPKHPAPQTAKKSVGDVPCDLCRDHNWLFVVASGRSGSTAVMDMLNAIPGVLVVGENDGFITRTGQAFEDLDAVPKAWSDKQYSAWWRTTPTFNHVLCDIQYLARRLVGELNRDLVYVGWKEIRYFKMDDLNTMTKIFPCAKFIVNFRQDIEAQAQSAFWKQRHASKAEQELSDRNRLYTNWARALGKDRAFVLTTEDIKVETFNRLLGWLGYSNCSQRPGALDTDV
ncbi:hypothetical protein CTAYLR_004067 [Chrysophaeum taylorii]|uniref:Sulfatase N-terminal domain-containing protein n=1 Tax=Chrysophaeum taylorii TaxID=2483200 RepID=A0AAD7UQ03_9STRA|nr:hypothetical protein CTAYLR_004067 [Chrysophaeum taylorii]